VSSGIQLVFIHNVGGITAGAKHAKEVDRGVTHVDDRSVPVVVIAASCCGCSNGVWFGSCWWRRRRRRRKKDAVVFGL
jgi:hypothetical protein